jgi:hypothetical protein
MEDVFMESSWVLKREAVLLAKECIATVQQLGVRLKLAHPEFLDLLGDYVDLLEDQTFKHNVTKLYAFAGLDPTFNVEPKRAEDPIELIEFLGKSYPRFKGNREFKSLYRGQPVYA